MDANFSSLDAMLNRCVLCYLCPNGIIKALFMAFGRMDEKIPKSPYIYYKKALFRFFIFKKILEKLASMRPLVKYATKKLRLNMFKGTFSLILTWTLILNSVKLVSKMEIIGQINKIFAY